jgi:hypothetical protein
VIAELAHRRDVATTLGWCRQGGVAKAITTMTHSGATDEIIVKILRYGADDLELWRQSCPPRSARKQ